MARRLVRFMLGGGLVLGVVVLVRRTMSLRSEAEHVVPSRDPWTPILEEFSAFGERAGTKLRAGDAAPSPTVAPAGTATGAAAVAPAGTATGAAAEVRGAAAAGARGGSATGAATGASSPVAWVESVDGSCPPTHTIKAKAASGIYHLPGMVNYERTNPDRCYATVEAAEADGFVRAKR